MNKLLDDKAIFQEDIINYTLDDFSILYEIFNFSFPKIVKYWAYCTSIYYKKEDFAIEIALDFRELIFDVLLVKPEEGLNITSYYSPNGEIVRKHLLTVISEKHWPVDKRVLHELQQKSGNINIGSSYIKERIHQYRVILLSLIDIIQEQKSDIFC